MGRAETSDIQVKDAAASRLHAEVEYDVADGFTVWDGGVDAQFTGKGSSNGTYVDSVQAATPEERGVPPQEWRQTALDSNGLRIFSFGKDRPQTVIRRSNGRTALYVGGGQVIPITPGEPVVTPDATYIVTQNDQILVRNRGEVPMEVELPPAPKAPEAPTNRTAFQEAVQIQPIAGLEAAIAEAERKWIGFTLGEQRVLSANFQEGSVHMLPVGDNPSSVRGNVNYKVVVPQVREDVQLKFLKNGVAIPWGRATLSGEKVRRT